MDVMPRLVWPSWRWMTISGTPSRAISTAWAWRSWCGGEASPHAGPVGEAAELRAGGGGRPRPASRRSADDAEQRSDRQLDARLDPGRELFEGPVVHSDLAAAAALATADEQRSAACVEVGLGERERLVDAQARAPEHDDQPAQPAAVDAVAGTAHDGDDLLDRWRVGWVAEA